MLEDELRATFAAKAGSPPPGSASALHGAADTAIAGAARVRRRRRAAVTGLSGFVAFAAASVAVLHTLTAGGTPNLPQAGSSLEQPTTEQRPSPGPAYHSSPTPKAMQEVDAIGPSAQATTRVRLQLPAASTVTAAYQAKDGYLVVNTQPDGDKQLVLQDEKEQQQVLVDNANDITVAKDGKTVAWAEQGKMNVGSRAANDGKKDETSKKLTKSVTTDVPDDTQPVAFVGTKLVMSNGDKGFDVWNTDRKYDPTWDKTVVRVFGGTTDNTGFYAEVVPVDPAVPMCLAVLKFGQPFTIISKVCGLPQAAKVGGRISPDGHWLAYPVDGLKQVAILDLTTVFVAVKYKPKVWTLTVTTKTVWLNASTFVVDDGKRFLKLNPAGDDVSDPVPLDQDAGQQSDQVVLIEPLDAQ